MLLYDGISTMGLGQLIRVNEDPARFRWEIEDAAKDGQAYVDLSVKDLMSQDRFRSRVLEQLNRLPPQVSRNEWTEIVDGALQRVIIVEAKNDSVK